MNHLSKSLLFSLMAVVSPQTLAQEPPVHIQLVTENTPITRALESESSGNGEAQNGGEATEFVQQLMEHSGLSYSLNFMPWRRAYHNAKMSENVLIFPIARTLSREQDFHWIGQLIPIKYYLFQLESRKDLQLDSLEAAKNYDIGVVNFHAHHELLIEQGFTNLQPVNSSEQNIKKLLLGRIDFFAMSDGGIFPLCQRTDIDCSKIKPALELVGISGGLFIAMNPSSDEAVVEKLAKSYQSLVDDGSHAEVFKKRLNNLTRFSKTWK